MITEQEVRGKIKELFCNKIKFGEPNECWLWLSKLSAEGYGQTTIKNRNGNQSTMTAHRAMYIYFFGDVEKGIDVCHNCPNGDNRRCVNPNHLWLGTHKQNIEDSNIKRSQNPKKVIIKSLRFSPFIDNKLIKFLQSDSEKIWCKSSEFNGMLTRYVENLLVADLKSRNIL